MAHGVTLGVIGRRGPGEQLGTGVDARYPFIVRLRSWLPTGNVALPWLAGLACALGGCSHYVQRGEALYREHRYIEAAEAFERTETRLPSSTSEERAEYGLYRGLTFLYLDDLGGARTWLGYAYSIVQKAPGALHQEERALLGRGFVELDQRSSATGIVRAAVSPVANAEAVPAGRVTRTPANGTRVIAPE